MSSGYLKLSQNLQDVEAINSIYLSSHSLKSQSQVMGFTDIANLCTNIEKISSDIIKKISPVNTYFLNLLKNSIDQISLEISKI
jgi:chemotaxis protein histidine kinase CheA